MPNKKGGYKIVSLKGLDLLTEELVIVGLFLALQNSYGKVILLDDIVIDGEEKKSAYVHAEKVGDNYVIKHVYGYDLTITDEDGVTAVENADGIELPVPETEDDGKIVGVNVQGKYVLKPSVKEQVESGAESGTIADVLGLDSEGNLVKGSVSGGTKLYLHKYVSAKLELRIIATTNESLQPSAIRTDTRVICAFYCTDNSVQLPTWKRVAFAYNNNAVLNIAYFNENSTLGITSVTAPSNTESEIVQL